MRTNLARRAVMWAAGVVLALSVGAWVLSLACVGCDGPLGKLYLYRGNFVAINSSGERWEFWAYGFAWPDWRSPGWRGVGPFRVVTIPLWIPALTAALVFAPACLIGRNARRWRHAGLCPSCGYDLTGITGKCPECGGMT